MKYRVWKKPCQIIFIPSQVTLLWTLGRRNKKRSKVYLCRREIKWKLIIRTLPSLLSDFWHLHREGTKATCSYQNKEEGKEVVSKQWQRTFLSFFWVRGRAKERRARQPSLERLSSLCSTVPALHTLTFARLFSMVPSNSLRSNGHDLKYRKFHSIIKKKQFCCEGIQTLEWITQRGCGVSTLL